MSTTSNVSMLDIHAAAIVSQIASYHEFLSRYSKDSRVVYGFVEGKEDPSFYRGFIELLLPDDWSVELWPAGNKDQVYNIHGSLDWRTFSKKRICFFVDRDLSELIPEKLTEDTNIYVTSGYSIENDVAKKHVCHRVLSEICGFSNADHAEMDSICEMFENELEAFLQAMIPIMAWILKWKRDGKRPSLSDILMRDLFFFSKEKLQMNSNPKGKTGTIEYIHEQCNIIFDDKHDNTPVQTEFRRYGNYKKLTRGKYVFWYLVEFCNAVHRDTALLFKRIAKPPKVAINLSHSNSMSIIAPRARIPRALREFLNATFITYIDKKNRKPS